MPDAPPLTVVAAGRDLRLDARRRRPISTAELRRLAGAALAATPKGAPASESLRRQLQAVERERHFSSKGRAIFHDLLARLGVATAQPIGLPLDDRPFWHRAPNPLAGPRSRPELPRSCDVLIIGAGLTGASAAYHLAKSGARKVVVIDQGDPAAEASGRNGVNFELLPENSVGAYEGFARERFRFLRRRYRDVPVEIARAVSERHASLVLGIAVRNRGLLRRIILDEGIDCDFSPRGWLHLACTEREEEALCEEVSFAAQHGERIEIWSRRRIREEFGFESAYLGRFIPGDGTYHPAKYVYGLMGRALER